MTPDTFPALFWAYTAIWFLVVLYILVLGRRLTRLERALHEETERLKGE